MKCRRVALYGNVVSLLFLKSSYIGPRQTHMSLCAMFTCDCDPGLALTARWPSARSHANKNKRNDRVDRRFSDDIVLEHLKRKLLLGQVSS